MNSTVELANRFGAAILERALVARGPYTVRKEEGEVQKLVQEGLIYFHSGRRWEVGGGGNEDQPVQDYVGLIGILTFLCRKPIDPHNA